MYYPEESKDVVFEKDARLCEVVVFQDKSTGDLVWDYSDNCSVECGYFLGIGAALLDKSGAWIKLHVVYYSNVDINGKRMLKTGELACLFNERELKQLNRDIAQYEEEDL